MKTAKLAIVIPLILFLAGAVFGSVPTKMSYEGRLVNSSGNPITTATTITFAIYGAASGGTAIWGPESQSVTPDSQGVFSVLLGNTTAITPDVFNSSTRYLEITVGGETLSPRTQLVSSGYAFMSAAAQTVEGGVVNRIVAGSGIGVSGNGSGTVTLTATGTGGGTVSQVSTGTGLTGGPVTTTGTISIDSTVATLTGTQTLTNKTISGASNTINNLDAGDISTGTVSTARLGSGTANNTTFLRGDQTWATPGGGGTVTQVNSGTGLTGGPITGTGTLAVNVGTGANQIVQLDASSKLPAVDGSALTGLTKTQVGLANVANVDTTNAANISSGTLGTARLGSGTASSSTFLRGDQTWATPGGGGTVTQIDTGTGLTGGPITGTGTISVDSTIATLTGTQTLTNKTISDASNTITLSAGTIPNLDASKIASGTLGTARLGSGTASGSTFLRGDQTWATPGGGGTVTSLDSGAGLTGGPVTGAGTLEVGAGAGITVTANAVGIDNTVVATLSDTQTLTNKTISGASNTINNLNAVNISSGTLVEARGGTNQSTYATGDLLYASGANTLAKLPIGANGRVLKITSGIPSWETAGGTGTVTQVDTGTGLTGGPITSTGTISIDSTVVTLTGTQTLTNKTLTLPVIASVSNSGTVTLPTGTETLVGRATTDTLTNKTISGASNTLTNLGITNLTIASEAQGDIIYRNASSWTRLPAGTAGQVLQTGGAGANPAWGNASAGTVTSVDSGAGLTGGPVTGAGTLEVGAGTGITVTANAVGIDNMVVATLNDTQTLTNKTISGASNTINNLNAGNISSGTLVEARGGTNQSTYATGDLLYASGANTLAKLPIGANGRVLKITSGIPSWETAGGTGTVTQVDTGTGLTGGPITSTGTISIDSSVVTLTGTQILTNKNLTAPTIGDLTNATHSHQNAAGGGALDAAAISTGTMAAARLGSGTANSDTVLHGNQTWAVPRGIPQNVQVFTTSGSWTKPANISTVWVEVWGAGGGGRNGSNNQGGGGGGGGGYSAGLVSVSGNVTVTVGIGGSGGNPASAGSASSFAGDSTLTGNGGSAGTTTSGAGGTATGGTINLTGGNGANGENSDGSGGGGGGGSPRGGSGGPGGVSANSPNPSQPGENGTGPGGGGGGGSENSGAGGSGANGLVIVSY